MKKEDLTTLGLTEEQIAGVQKLNGLDIEAEKKKTTLAEGERDKFKEQYETTQAALKEFDGIDVKELQGKIEKLNTDLAAKDTEYTQKIADRDFQDALNAAIVTAGGKNGKAVMALLDVENLKASKNQEADIKAAIEACQKDNDFLFGANEPINQPVGPTGGPTPSLKPLNEMSYDEYKAYRQGK